MTPVTCMAGRTLALFGLGGSGVATLAALKAGGADVLAWDDSEASRARARAAGHALVDLRDADWSGLAALVLAPGVPLTHPAPHWMVERAKAAGIEVIGDIELFCRERATIAPGSPFVAITGTNGKSTTTALVAHILRSAGRDVQMGGNIGTAILSLDPPTPERVHVIEMSSFQIDLTPSFGRVSTSASPAGDFGAHGPSPSPEGKAESAKPNRGGVNPAAVAPPRFEAALRLALPPGEGEARPAMGPSPEDEERGRGPTVGVLLNITPDHLDRHGTMENYAAIKERLVAGAEVTIVGVDDEASEAVARRMALAKAGFARSISAERRVDEGVFADGSRLVAAARGMIAEVADIAGIGSLRGTHNAQNAAAAVAVALALGLDEGAIAGGLESFPGLRHRMEEVARRGGALFVNDSKATNADSAEKALLSFGRIFWILGGKAKEGGIAPLGPLLPKVEKAYLIGEATDAFAATLEEGGVAYERCGTLDRAVSAAAEDAMRSDAREPVVLLSPACASYDQYPNFEVRGDRFRDLVLALPGAVPVGA